jgi:hypothetical protein
MIYPDLNNITWHRPFLNRTKLFSSFAQCKDGRIVFSFYDLAYSEAINYSRVTYGHATSYQTFLVAGGVSNIVYAMTDASRSMRGSFFNVGDELYMSLVSTTVGGAVGTFKAEIYQSTSGNGVDEYGVPDWVLFSTVWSWEYPGGYFLADMWNMGIPYITGGRWIITTPCVYIGLAPMFHAGIYTSDDGGYSWTQRYHRGIGAIGGAYTENASRMIVEFNGSLYFTVEGNTSNGVLVKGTSNGSTWTTLYQFNVRGWIQSMGHFLLNNGDGNLWMGLDCYGGEWLLIYYSTDPDVVETCGGWIKTKEYHIDTTLWDFYHPYTSPVKNEWGNDILLVGSGGYVSNGTPPDPGVCACKASNRILSASSRRYIEPFPVKSSSIIIP